MIFEKEYIEQIKEAVYLEEYEKWNWYTNEDGTLKHKLIDILTEGQSFDEKEAEIVSAKSKTVSVESFDVDGLCNLHKELFDEVFDWAGQLRLVDVSKPEPSLNFRTIEYDKFYEIRPNLSTKIDTLQSKDWGVMNDSEKIHELAESMSDIWRTHAFLEGNTRTTSKFCFEFAKTIGLEFDELKIKDDAVNFRNALAKANDFGYSFDGIYEFQDSTELEKTLCNACGLDPETVQVAFQDKADSNLSFEDLLNDEYFDLDV